MVRLLPCHLRSTYHDRRGVQRVTFMKSVAKLASSALIVRQTKLDPLGAVPGMVANYRRGERDVARDRH